MQIPDIIGWMKESDVRRLTEALWKNSEEYHAGAVDYATFGHRNRDIWNEIERLGLRAEVSKALRDAR